MNNLNIYIESNPNPNSLKFVTNIMLVDEGIVKDYPNIQSAEDSPLAKKLFDFNYVKRVFIMSNFITITKSEKFSWEEIKLDLRDFIKKYIEEENEIISKTKKQSSVKSESKSNNIDEKIKLITADKEPIDWAVFSSKHDQNIKHKHIIIINYNNLKDKLDLTQFKIIDNFRDCYYLLTE